MVVSTLDLVIRLSAAAGLAAIVGLERERKHHPAGLRTNILVSVGCAGFTLLALFVMSDLNGTPAELSRMLQGLIGGIGFLGAGAVLHSRAGTHGLTTAAAVWCVAAVGVACGLGHFLLAALLVGITVSTLLMLSPLEKRLFPFADPDSRDPEP